MTHIRPIIIIGGGLAGCEAAWQLAKRGHEVTLHEMKPGKLSLAATSRRGVGVDQRAAGRTRRAARRAARDRDGT